MIEITKTQVVGWEAAIRGMRNPLNSWARSDSKFAELNSDHIHSLSEKYWRFGELDGSGVEIGPNDLNLMVQLARQGPVHGKFRRMIVVYADILAPLYWWKEFDTYKVGTVANSCSTMHKISAKEFTIEDFSCEHLVLKRSWDWLNKTIEDLNVWRNLYLNGGEEYSAKDGSVVTYEPKDKEVWWQMIQTLPSSYNQLRTVEMNYEMLVGAYNYRRFHKQDEWRKFCRWVESLPYAEDLITCYATSKS